MKNIFLLLFLVLLITSCEDFLVEDTSSIISADSEVMKTQEGLEAAMVGAYKPLSYTWRTGFGNASSQAVMMGSDDLTTHKASNKADFREFDQFNITDLNYRLAFIWNGAYKCIQGCNLIIDNYQEATGDRAVIEQIAGEAYYLRAYNYFWIARLWKQAPLMLHSQNYDEANLSIDPVQTQALYDQIILDLNEAMNLMADTRVQPGRASAASAKACLAEVYLQMTGWPLKQTDKYAMAAQVAKDLIDNQEQYGLGLLDNFEDLWKSEFDGNSEEVFALTFSGTNGNWNGNAMYGAAARPEDLYGWHDFMSEITFFEEYPEQVRKDVTFFTEFVNGDGETVPWQNFTTGRPYYEKFFGDANFWNLPKSNPLERFAEVYFIYAEAQVMATGNTSDASALEALNKIVRRAYGEPLDQASAYDYTSATQAEIIQEKAWEFAGEFCRWFDLTRLEMVEEITAKRHPDELQPLGPIEYWLPVPGTETLVNEKLGY